MWRRSSSRCGSRWCVAPMTTSDVDHALSRGAEGAVGLGEAESPNRAAGVLVETRRHGNRGDAVLDDQAMRDLLVGLLRGRRVIKQLEVGARARQRAES